ncbi:hypothetical protein IGI04_030085, partial [Brassica rapa subsp. trilocularis]
GWVDSIWQDHNLDTWYQGFYAARLRFYLGIKKGICGSLWKAKIWFEWQRVIFFIKTKSPTDSVIVFNNHRLGSNRGWGLWLFWEMKLDSINLQRYERGDEYLLNEDMEIWERYNMMIRASPWCIILSLCYIKGVVINGKTGQHNNERDSKWVKAGERGSRRPPNNYGNYRGPGEGSRFKTSSREDVRNGATDVGTAAQESHNRLSSEQSIGDQGQRVTPQKGREEGEIKSNGEAAGASVEFQLELARMQAEGTEVIMEAIDEERGLLTVQGMIEAQDDLAEDIGMEMEALNATMLEEGEEAEKAAEALTEHAHIQEEEDQVIGDVNFNKESTVGNMVARQGHRKRLFKPTISTAWSNKMRMASALFFPRKKVGAKVGTRNGDGNKPPKNKGPSNPKQGMGVTIMVLALLFSIMIWNKNGLLSSRCPPDVYMFVRHGREILFILEGKYGRVWRSSIDLFFTAFTSFGIREVIGVSWGVLDVNKGIWMISLGLGWFDYESVLLSWQNVRNSIYLWLLDQTRRLKMRGVWWSVDSANGILCYGIIWCLLSCYNEKH